MNKHPEPLFQKRTFSPPGRINFANIFITPPKTFQFDLGIAGKEILTLSALYRSCQFLPLSDRTIIQYDIGGCVLCISNKVEYFNKEENYKNSWAKFINTLSLLTNYIKTVYQQFLNLS